MSRYIDADVLSKYFDALEKHAEMEGLYNHAHLYNRCLRLVEETPTADVVEVRHGHWVDENRRPHTSKFICSECGELAYYVQPPRDKTWKKCCPYKYCPNCGAKMDGERSENGTH